MVQLANEFSFPVELQRLFTKEGVEASKSRGVIRTDTQEYLSTVSDQYKLYTHQQVMDAVTPFTKKIGSVAKVTYDLDRRGARLIATHRYDDVVFKIKHGHGEEGRKTGDVVALEVIVINSYNAQTSLEFRIGGRVLRCLNGATAFDGLFNLRYRHLGDSWTGELPDPGVVIKAYEKTTHVWSQWSEMELSAKTRSSIVEQGRVLGILPKRYYEQEAQRFDASETVWDLYNAFTYVNSNVAKRTKTSGRLNRMDRINAVFQHALSA